MILLKVLAGWFVLNMVALAMFWFFATVINPLFPHWHQKRIRDFEPKYQGESKNLSVQPYVTKNFG